MAQKVLISVCVFLLFDHPLAVCTCLFAFSSSISSPLAFVRVFACLMAILLLVWHVCAPLVAQ